MKYKLRVLGWIESLNEMLELKEKKELELREKLNEQGLTDVEIEVEMIFDVGVDNYPF